MGTPRKATHSARERDHVKAHTRAGEVREETDGRTEEVKRGSVHVIYRVISITGTQYRTVGRSTTVV